MFDGEIDPISSVSRIDIGCQTLPLSELRVIHRLEDRVRITKQYIKELRGELEQQRSKHRQECDDQNRTIERLQQENDRLRDEIDSNALQSLPPMAPQRIPLKVLNVQLITNDEERQVFDDFQRFLLRKQQHHRQAE